MPGILQDMTVRARIDVCAGPTMERSLRFLCFTAARRDPPAKSTSNYSRGCGDGDHAAISAASRASFNIDELSSFVVSVCIVNL